LLLSLESVGAFPASDSHTIGLILLGSSSRSSCSPRC
jgi:hypothetical protein